MKKLLVFLMAASLLLCGCSKDKSTGPDNQGSIYLSRLVVSMVPEASEAVTIHTNGAVGDLEVSHSATGVASADISDSTLTVTGVTYGIDTLTITCGEASCILPVQVYNPFVLETEELLITFVDSYTLRWNDLGSGGSRDGSFYHPITTNGFRALGTLACGPNGYPNPNGTFAMMVVKAKPGHEDALADPVGYQLIYNDHGSGAHMYGSFWRPLPPAGYVAMGTVVALNTWNQPSLSDVVCVRSDLTIMAEAGAFIYDDLGTGADMYLSCWKIDQPDAGPHNMAYLVTGTFVGVGNWNCPSTDPVLYVLKVDLPELAEAPYQSYVPTLTGYDSPPEETSPLMAKAMLVPCSIINDATYAGNIGWQVANSPLYRLERQVYYKLQYHNHNQTSEIQTNSVLIRSGITTTESERIWDETSVSLSVEAGVSIKAFSAKVTATVSQSFGYETQTSVSELQQREVSSSINTSPGKAAALWQQYNRYILYRHNGIALEPVSSWEFGIDSYVTDEYPDD